MIHVEDHAAHCRMAREIIVVVVVVVVVVVGVVVSNRINSSII